MTKYKATIGLEVHAELKTRTKMFCDSINDPEEKTPNVNICPICMAHPGTLPVINKEAVKHVLKVGLAVGGALADFTEFDRKNYFYPDIPKGYQISQYKYPLVSSGTLNGVKLTRIHLEEDTGKLIHADKHQRISADKNQHQSVPESIRANPSLYPRESASLVDFNRAGIPLMELVTEPVVKSAEEASAFARELQLLLRTLGASDANMEKGEMRVEANVSVAPINADKAETRINADTGELLYEDLSYKIRGAAFAVYNELGSGHKESVYQNALAQHLEKIGVVYAKEKHIPVTYENKKVGSYQPDFVIEDKVIVEIKALPFMGRIEKDQVQYYLKNSSYRLALIINFGSSPIHIERVEYDSIRDNLLSYPRQSAPLGTKVEVKNLNSFRTVERAIAFEIDRQTKALERGEKVIQETRGWDEGKQITFSQRLKEESHDYRYFPDPDLPKLKISEIKELSDTNLRKELPELPWEKRERLIHEFGIKQSSAEMFVQDQQLGIFFETVVKKIGDRRGFVLAENYITSDLAGLMKESGSLESIIADNFSALIKMLLENKVSSRGAKEILLVMYQKGGSPETIADSHGLLQKSDEGELTKIVKKILDENQNIVAEYKQGKTTSLQFLIGQGMRATKGSANPEILKKLFIELLEK